MKKIIKVSIISIIIILFSISPIFAADATAKVNASNKEVRQGESFFVTFSITQKDSVNGLIAEVSYDENVLELTEKEILNNFVNMGENLKFELLANEDFTSGDVIKLTFKVKENTKKETKIKFSNIVVDSNVLTNSERAIEDKDIKIKIMQDSNNQLSKVIKIVGIAIILVFLFAILITFIKKHRSN